MRARVMKSRTTMPDSNVTCRRGRRRRRESSSAFAGPTPIFIIGVARSGTTLLECMLGNHSATPVPTATISMDWLNTSAITGASCATAPHHARAVLDVPTLTWCRTRATLRKAFASCGLGSRVAWIWRATPRRASTMSATQVRPAPQAITRTSGGIS